LRALTGPDFHLFFRAVSVCFQLCRDARDVLTLMLLVSNNHQGFIQAPNLREWFDEEIKILSSSFSSGPGLETT
jgi:hypothetical protein